MGRPILKTLAEVEQMRSAARVVFEALALAESMLEPGVSTLELDQAVEALIRKSGGRPAFKGYPSPTPGVAPFPGSICASLNEEVVHGIPSVERQLRDGDIVSIDVGVEKDGFFGDAARTFPVGNVGRKVRRLLETGTESLARATALMRPGRTLSRVCREIQSCAEERRYSVVRQFVGHGIGAAMHEPPQVPNFVDRKLRGRDLSLEPGLVLAIEPMVNAGRPEVEVMEDGWTVRTRDRSLSVHFEDTIAVGPDGPLVLTMGA